MANIENSTSNLISQTYESVMNATGFQNYIENLQAAFQLKSVTMVIRHVETQDVKGLWTTGIERKWVESYALDYAREDILAHHIMVSPIAHFYASNLDVSHPENFPETRFFREWVLPQEIGCVAGAVVLQEGEWVTQVIIQRGSNQALFERGELEQLNELMPHLQKAIQMRQRFVDLQIGQNFLIGGLNVLSMATFLFNEKGMVAHLNQSAETLLGNDSGILLHNNYLRTQNHDVTRQLNLEIFKAIDASRGKSIALNDVILLPRTGCLPLMLMISPLYLRGTASVQGGALLFAFDPANTPTMTIDLVCRLFSLSKGEAKLAVALCEGKTLEEIAIANGTSIHTVKSQLKNTFLKTGTKRQSELVSLLLASPAYFLALKPQ